MWLGARLSVQSYSCSKPVIFKPVKRFFEYFNVVYLVHISWHREPPADRFLKIACNPVSSKGPRMATTRRSPKLASKAETARARVVRTKGKRPEYRWISENETDAAATLIALADEKDGRGGPFVHCVLHWTGDLPESPDCWIEIWDHYLSYLQNEPEIVFSACPDPELMRDSFQKCAIEFRIGTGLHQGEVNPNN
jgi:hypothetical protein